MRARGQYAAGGTSRSLSNEAKKVKARGSLSRAAPQPARKYGAPACRDHALPPTALPPPTIRQHTDRRPHDTMQQQQQALAATTPPTSQQQGSQGRRSSSPPPSPPAEQGTHLVGIRRCTPLRRARARVQRRERSIELMLEAARGQRADEARLGLRAPCLGDPEDGDRESLLGLAPGQQSPPRGATASSQYAYQQCCDEIVRRCQAAAALLAEPDEEWLVIPSARRARSRSPSRSPSLSPCRSSPSTSPSLSPSFGSERTQSSSSSASSPSPGPPGHSCLLM